MRVYDTLKILKIAGDSANTTRPLIIVCILILGIVCVQKAAKSFNSNGILLR